MNNWAAESNGQRAPEGSTDSPAPRLRLVPFDKTEMATSAAYLIRDIIPREGLVVIWGPPKCGKSFWTFDAIMHVALDWEYRRRRVRQGTVVYVACEGERGLGARVEAFRRSKLAEDSSVPGFHLLATRLDLVKDQQRLIEDTGAQRMSAQFIAKALGGQRAGSSWLAPCPAHEHRTPSLALRDGDAGRVLVHCHAGCDQEAVAQQIIVAAEAGAAP